MRLSVSYNFVSSLPAWIRFGASLLDSPAVVDMKALTITSKVVCCRYGFKIQSSGFPRSGAWTSSRTTWLPWGNSNRFAFNQFCFYSHHFWIKLFFFYLKTHKQCENNINQYCCVLGTKQYGPFNDDFIVGFGMCRVFVTHSTYPEFGIIT